MCYYNINMGVPDREHVEQIIDELYGTDTFGRLTTREQETILNAGDPVEVDSDQQQLIGEGYIKFIQSRLRGGENENTSKP